MGVESILAPFCDRLIYTSQPYAEMRAHAASVPSGSEVPAVAPSSRPSQLARVWAAESFYGRAAIAEAPGCCRRVAEGDERAPRLNVNVAGLHAVLGEFSPRGLDIGNDALQARL